VQASTSFCSNTRQIAVQCHQHKKHIHNLMFSDFTHSTVFCSALCSSVKLYFAIFNLCNIGIMYIVWKSRIIMQLYQHGGVVSRKASTVSFTYFSLKNGSCLTKVNKQYKTSRDMNYVKKLRNVIVLMKCELLVR